MREIKFRAWDAKKKLMVESGNYSDYSFAFENSTLRCWRIDEPPHHDATSISNIMQYTGLSDKNGIEIYEGDIVSQELSVSYGGDGYSEGVDIDNTFVGEVAVLASKGVCMKKPKVTDNYDESTTRSNGYINVRGYRCEIIGNIFQNPELIKELS